MAQQQSGQPVGGGANSGQKFPWVKLAITILVIAAIVLFFLWQFGVLTPNEYSSTSIAGLLKVDPGTATEWHVDQYNNILYVKTDKGSFSIIVAPTQLSDLLKMITGSVTKPADTTTIGRLINILGGEAANELQGQSVSPPKTSFFSSLLVSLLPTLIFFGLIFFLMRRASRGSGGLGDIFQGGKNQARKIVSKVRFSDVAGQEEVKEEVAEVVDFLKRPGPYQKAGARIPKGIMLGGPPGVGKTLLAKAVAGEASVPFYFISASNFVEMFAGLGAKRVREMFKEARKASPSILFIDELDAIGRKRGSSLSGNDEREQTLNQILVEMDGMDENSGLLIIAATNRPDVLDPALLRPGRFDRKITVGLPDIKEREEILRLHAKGKRISNDVDFKAIAKRIPRFSGAQIENVINEAALLSVREKTEVITLQQIDEAIDRVNAGPAKKHRVITPEENRMVAVHEAGHAVTGLKVEDADIVQKITIIPRGDAGGYMLQTPKKEKYNYSKTQLEGMIITALGGRAAEQVIYGIGEVSTGASDDIEKATKIARAMVTQYGMSKLGPIAYERNVGPQYLGSSNDRTKEYSDALAERIDGAIRDIILLAETKAINIIKKNKQLLNLIVDELLDKETIVAEEIDYIHKHLKRPPRSVSIKARKPKKQKSLMSIIDQVDHVDEKQSKSNSQAKTSKAKPKTPKAKPKSTPAKTTKSPPKPTKK